MSKPRLPKYRGQRINTKEWIEGMPAKRKDMLFIETETTDENGNLRYKGMEIIPETLGEYAGKLGANAIEVWEGDAVLASLNVLGKPTGHEFKAYIYWNEHAGAWQIMYEAVGGHTRTENIGFSYFLTKTTGTIHDLKTKE